MEIIRGNTIKPEHRPRLPSYLVRHQDILVVIMTLVLLGGLYFYNLDGWRIDDDEGSFLYQAWRVSEGEQPYTDFSSSRWPFFLYTSGWLVDLFGRNLWSIRAVSTLLTLITALVLFFLTREILPTESAWIALVAFLLFPATFSYGRRLYPEVYMLCFDMLGLYLFCRGWNQKQRILIVLAGLSFGTAVFFKPVGILPIMGCLLWMLAQLWQHRQQWRKHLQRALLFVLPFCLLSGTVAASLAIWIPNFYSAAIGVSLAEGTKESTGAINGIMLLLSYLLNYLPLMAFVLPAAWFGRNKFTGGSLLAWQLPTALAFLGLSRTLFPRHLHYLTPTLAILFAVAVDPLRRWTKRSFLSVSVVCAILLPWLVADLGQAILAEDDTAHITEMIRSSTEPGAYVLADYQELNFHAERRSTYRGAEISGVLIEQGQLAGEQLIEEIERYDVRMVIIDVSGHHLITLPDYDLFLSYLDETFEILGRWPRSTQMLLIYVRH